MRHQGRTRSSPTPSKPRPPPFATKTWAMEAPAACHFLLRFWDRAPDRLHELALDAVRMLEADLACDFGDDVGVDAVVAIAELDVQAAPDLRMRLHDRTNARCELSVASGHVL